MPKALAVILNLSLKRNRNGKKIVNHVKKELIHFIKNNFDHEDVFYLYNPELTTTFDTLGDQVSLIANYETDGYPIDEYNALRQTYFVLENADADFDRVFCYITDRPTNNLYRIFRMHRNDYRLTPPCQFVVFGLGNNLSKECGAEAKFIGSDDISSSLREFYS